VHGRLELGLNELLTSPVQAVYWKGDANPASDLARLLHVNRFVQRGAGFDGADLVGRGQFRLMGAGRADVLLLAAVERARPSAVRLAAVNGSLQARRAKAGGPAVDPKRTSPCRGVLPGSRLSVNAPAQGSKAEISQPLVSHRPQLGALDCRPQSGHMVLMARVARSGGVVGAAGSVDEMEEFRRTNPII